MGALRSVLDAWAVVALVRDEPPAERVQRAIEQGAVASWINLGEAIYVLAADTGGDEAAAVVAALAAHVNAEEPDAPLVVAAATLKAQHPISYADAFCVATAERHRLPVLTGDPEIVALRRPGLEVVDLRAS